MTSTSESAQAITRRLDNDAERRVLTELQEPGRTLHKPAKLDVYYVHDGRDYVPGTRLSAARVQKLERGGVIQHVGVHRYALAE